MRRVDGATVTRLTLGDLLACPELVAPTGADDARAEVSNGHSSGVARREGPHTRSHRSATFDARERRRHERWDAFTDSEGPPRNGGTYEHRASNEHGTWRPGRGRGSDPHRTSRA